MSDVPHGLGSAGRELWDSIVDDFELEVHESRLLLQAARIADLLDDLADVVAREGVIIDSPTGARTHPAVVESRLQSLALGRLLTALRLPAGEEDNSAQGGSRRPQRRVAFRGPQAIRAVS